MKLDFTLRDERSIFLLHPHTAALVKSEFFRMGIDVLKKGRLRDRAIVLGAVFFRDDKIQEMLIFVEMLQSGHAGVVTT